MSPVIWTCDFLKIFLTHCLGSHCSSLCTCYSEDAPFGSKGKSTEVCGSSTFLEFRTHCPFSFFRLSRIHDSTHILRSLSCDLSFTQSRTTFPRCCAISRSLAFRVSNTATRAIDCVAFVFVVLCRLLARTVSMIMGQSFVWRRTA